MTIIAEYIDRALTGTTDKRPQFLKMIDDSKKKHFEYVLVYQLDRFARNRYDSANYKAKLKKNGTEFTVNQLSRIIRNEKYIGRITIDDTIYSDVVPPIIDARLFKECNLMMDEHKHRQHESKSEKPYILSGKMFCG